MTDATDIGCPVCGAAVGAPCSEHGNHFAREVKAQAVALEDGEDDRAGS
jgi:hypothetical protein